MPSKALKAIFLTGCFFIFGLVSVMFAQNRFQGGTLPEIDKLSANEIQPFIESFRNQRLSQDYSFRFYLRNMPRRGKEKYYYGIMWGTWNEIGPLTRVRVWEENSENVTDFLLQNGPEPAIWVSKEGSDSVSLPQTRWQEPLMEGLEYTGFDFLMPFIYWNEYVYEGSKRVKGRPAHIFMIRNQVRLVIDSSYRALIRAEILANKSDIIKTFKVIDFKKVDNEWIVKSIDLVNEKNHDKTRFQVTAAALGINIPPHYFTPDALGKFVPMIEEDKFIPLQ